MTSLVSLAPPPPPPPPPIFSSWLLLIVNFSIRDVMYLIFFSVSISDQSISRNVSMDVSLDQVYSLFSEGHLFICFMILSLSYSYPKYDLFPHISGS
jgi:hypothetical protein